MKKLRYQPPARQAGKSEKIYMAHVWDYGPIIMSFSRARALLLKHTGSSYYWLGDTCHVYLRSVCEVVLKSPKVKGVI